jgi:hypothetical protein
MGELLTLAKQCLSIVSTATAKDQEIKMLIQAGQNDMERQGIEVDTTNDLVKATIMMYVKANFGNTDIKEKELAQRTYILLCKNLGLSENYQEGGEQ